MLFTHKKFINIFVRKIMKKNFDNRAQRNSCETNGDPFNVVKVAFSPKAFDQIKKTIGSRPAESGGALFGKPEDLRSPIPYITDFVFDNEANATRVTYSINAKFLNPVIHDKWGNHGLELHGIIHSHPGGCSRPSSPDMEYFHKMHTYMERPFIITPIIFTEPDGGFKMFCYLVGSDTPAIEVEYCIMDEKEHEEAIAAIAASKQENSEMSQQERNVENNTAPEKPAKDTTDENISEDAICIGHRDVTMGIDYCCEADAVDIDKLKQSKIVIVGTGGMYEGASMFARTGIGEIIAIDPDKVEPRNICRQGYLPRQNGMYKVDALGEHIKEINPDVKYKGYPVKLQDLTPKQEEEIFSSASIAIFTTDSFDAQAYGNKIALRYNIPAIWGGFYEKSLASEIVFYIPGVTPACFRCAVSPRYKFQEDYKANNNGKELSISSACNTIFHSALLDAQIGMLAMAIIHNMVEGKTFSGWFGDYFDKNLIQMKVNPLYQSRLFDRVFAGSGDSAFLFESVWQQIEPEIPPKYALCPDCHGGDMQKSEHTENGETSERNND